MNAVTDIWNGLVARRLWPVALLLLAALAAVPFLLAKEAEVSAPVTATAKPAADGQDLLAAQPIVAVTSTQQREKGRAVIGKVKNPFKPAVAARKAKEPRTSTSASSTAKSGSSVPAGTKVTLPDGTTVSFGSKPADQPSKKRYELYTIAVRFGLSSEAELKTRNLRRLKALPSVENPLVIYLGVLGDGKTAVFMVDSSVLAQGDGRCNPSPENCQTIHLKRGETEYLDVRGADGKTVQQYQLDMVKIRRTKTSDASAARKAHTATAAGGRKALRRNMGRVGRYRYDAESGTLKRIGEKAWKASVARAARR